MEAVVCALEIQEELAELNADLPERRRMLFRIGVHLGDLVAEGDRIYGDGVNVTARLESLAEPGGVCISGAVRDQVRGKHAIRLDDLGDHSMKNLPEPVRVYRARRGDGAPGEAGRPRRRVGRGRIAALGGLGLALVLVLALAASWPAPLGWLLDWTGASGPGENPPLPDKPSIVVLPFANMSGDREQEYFADGISEDLTTELARNDALFVISRNSAFSYKGQAVKVEDVARELGVRYVLEGSVRRAGDRVRITAQLIDASTGFHLWSERYDRRLTDIFALQTELADEIQTALRVEIRDAEIARVRQPETRNVDAYDAYLRGLAHFEHFRLERNREARRWFARAIELDPEFASAHAMVGNTYGIEYMFGWNTDPALMARAEEGARRALELDIASSDAWTVLATVHLTRGEHEAAITAAERGIAAEPSLEVPYLIRGMALADQGRILPALASIAQARRLNPEGGTTDLEVFAFVESLAGRIDEAVAMLEQARAANPDLIYSRLFLLVQRDAEGRGDEARALAAEVLSINSDLTAEQGAMLLRESGAVEPLRRAGLP